MFVKIGFILLKHGKFGTAGKIHNAIIKPIIKLAIRLPGKAEIASEPCGNRIRTVR